MSDDEVRPCSACGASVYQEHVDSGIAGYSRGKLLCAPCLAEATVERGQPSAAAVLADSGGSQSGLGIAVTEPATARAATAVRTLLGDAHGVERDAAKFKRPLIAHAPGSTRCRTFHAKLNDAAIAFMNDHINDWVDAHPDVAIKFATTTVGVFEGKHPEPNLIVTIFY